MWTIRKGCETTGTRKRLYRKHKTLFGRWYTG